MCEPVAIKLTPPLMIKDAERKVGFSKPHQDNENNPYVRNYCSKPPHYDVKLYKRFENR